MKDYYLERKQEILKELDSHMEGLSTSEAEKSFQTHGPNALEETKKQTTLQVFISQFKDLMVVILIIAALISATMGDVESTLVILAVLVLNAVLGTIQHVKAEKSLASLKSLSSPTAKVLRDGNRIEIPSEQVVVGDIMSIEAGDMVVADGRILNNFSLQVNESSLTGESTNVEKADMEFDHEVPLADRLNMVYSGSLVTYGRATILVTGTGMQTEIGKIASLMNATKEKRTPLQIAMDNFSSKLALVIMIICAIVLGMQMVHGQPLMDSLLFAVALAVAAVPEALSPIVTIVQAMGTQRMAKENAIIKNLAAVESLGSVSVICSDKTGTLTQNKMTVEDIFVGNELHTSATLDIQNPLHKYLIYNAVLNNDSSIADGKGIGDPTEYALLEMYRKVPQCQNEDELRDQFTRIEEVPFDSDRKLMSTKYNIDGSSLIFTKGAVDVLLDRCTSIYLKDGIHPLTETEKQKITQQNLNFSSSGLRVLAFAYKESNETLSIDTENNFVFLGLISEMDPPRQESMDAVAKAKKAGIRTVMITGDHKVTATAIAKRIGIFEKDDIAVTGMELDAMSDQELDDNIEKISVYARVSPENKIRIVDAWQSKGRIVSMTGDGVNDAPALKKADIGVAMGITGTEVSKDAASMILADDNFATIIKAVANGRTIYENIRNAILYLLSGNLSAILTVIYASLLALPVPFKAVQLLFINLVTDSLPALAIGMEPGSNDILDRKPRDPKAGLMDQTFIRRFALQGILIAIAVVVAFMIGIQTDASTGCTMAFATLTLARLFHGFNCRSEHSIFRIGFKRNWYSLYAFLLGVCLLSLILFVPSLHSLFSVTPLTSNQALSIGGLAILPTILIQIKKVIWEHRK